MNVPQLTDRIVEVTFKRWQGELGYWYWRYGVLYSRNTRKVRLLHRKSDGRVYRILKAFIYYYHKEQRILMEQIIGRPLTRNEDVHHINGIKSDNRIENLRILTKQEHSRIHTKKFKLATKTS